MYRRGLVLPADRQLIRPRSLTSAAANLAPYYTMNGINAKIEIVPPGQAAPAGTKKRPPEGSRPISSQSHMVSAMMAFWVCSRFSASSKMTLA